MKEFTSARAPRPSGVPAAFSPRFDLPPRHVARKISESTVRRLSRYLRILEKLERAGDETVSSVDLAGHAGTTAAQVRKDFSLFGSFGKRGTGYAVDELVTRIREILGLGDGWNVALVGAGRIGAALFEYGDFRRRGFRMKAILDSDVDRVGERWGDVAIDPVSELERVVRERAVDIVVIAVPAEAAQGVAERAVAAGVRGILNFAPTQLRLPEGTSVQNVNLVMEFEALSFDLTRAAEAESDGDGDPGTSPEALAG